MSFGAPVQEAVLNSAGNGTLTSFTISLTGVGAGNSLLLYLNATSGDFSTNPTLSVSDNVSGTWTKVTGQDCASHLFGNEQDLWECASSPGGNVTVTIGATHAPGSTSFSAWLSEWPTLGAADVIATPFQSGGATTSLVSQTITPTQAGDLVLIMMTAGHAINGSPASPWTDDNAATWFGGILAPVAYQVAPGTTGLSATWTSASNSFTASLAVAFKNPSLVVVTPPIAMLV